MHKYLLSRGNKRRLDNKMMHIQNGFAMVIAFFVIVGSLLYPEPFIYRSIGFGLIFALIFISYSSPGSTSLYRVPFYDLMLSVLSMTIAAYICFNANRLVNRFVFYDTVTPWDMVLGCVAILLLLEGTRRIIGPWLPMLTVTALVYLFFGHYIPGRFGHQGFTFSYIIDGLFLSSQGMWGSTLGIAIGHVMVFLIFGAFILKSGAGDFLYDFAAAIAGSSKGGLAKISVISSAMFGMITGGPLSNVSTTGSLTIPAMIKKGYSPEFAASTESCASIGGTFVPPVMGSVIFIMSEVIGIPYGEIAKKAALPAIVYFAALFFVIDAKSKKMGIGGEEINSRRNIFSLLLRGSGFFIPIGYLVYRILLGISPSKAGIETIVVILAVNLLGNRSLFNLERFQETLRTAVNRGMMIVATLTTCGVMIGIINITGITSKMTSYLMAMIDFSLMSTLVLVMGITLFLGLAMNTSSSYIITSVICAPVLVMAGLEPLSVHMFILYYAAASSITPPVAMTSFVAASIANVSPMKVGIQSMKMGAVAYLLPFVFVLNPALLLYGSMIQIVLSFTGAITGVACIAYGITGWWQGKSAPAMIRAVLLISGVAALSGQFLLMLAASTSVGAMWFIQRATENKLIKFRKGDTLYEEKMD